MSFAKNMRGEQVNVMAMPFLVYIMTDMPLLTMVKKQILAEKPALSAEDEQLEQTLSMLCSFYSLDDMMSFISSEKFRSLALWENAWIGFEIGLYKDHTKTIEFIPSAKEYILADSLMSGVFENHVWKGTTAEELQHALLLWLNLSMSGLQ